MPELPEKPPPEPAAEGIAPAVAESTSPWGEDGEKRKECALEAVARRWPNVDQRRWALAVERGLTIAVEREQRRAALEDDDGDV